MAARHRMKPETERGRKLLAFVLKTFGSIQAAARKANVSEPTMRRRIYRDTAKIDRTVTERLIGVGVPRDLAG